MTLCVNSLSIINSLRFYSASATHLSLPQPYVFPLLLLTLLKSLSPQFFASSILPLFFFESRHQSPSLSLSLELVWEVFPGQRTSSFTAFLPSLISFLCRRLNSHVCGEKAAERNQWRRKKERKGLQDKIVANRKIRSLAALSSLEVNLMNCSVWFLVLTLLFWLFYLKFSNLFFVYFNCVLQG